MICMLTWFTAIVVQDGKSCLHVAAYYGQLDTVKYLCELQNEKLMLLKDDSGSSPFLAAMFRQHWDVVAYLKSLKKA